MLPSKIQNYIKALTKRTQENLIKWNYSNQNGVVSCETEKNNVEIEYKYDFEIEKGIFIIRITDNSTKNIFPFSTDEFNSDFEDVKILFNEAKSSELDLDFDFDFDF